MALKNKKLNKDLLPLERDKEFELPAPGAKLDYSRFVTNNWLLSEQENEILKAIEKKGGALWLGFDGIIRFRVRGDEDIMQIEVVDQAQRAISSFLGLSKVRLFKGAGAGGEAVPPDVFVYDLKSAKDLFTPFTLSEFYTKNGLWYRSSFRPTEYIVGCLDKSENLSPDTILRLIDNLANHDTKRYDWMMNWLAGFFQSLRKSQVSLVLRGDQGSGKGIFFTKVITPLFGKDYCLTVDSNNLESNFKNWIEGRLFLNLNEVAVDMKGRRNVKNFLKQLVTDELINVETKFKDANEKRVFANILISSNEAFPIEVEPSDRRFTVFQTGKALKALGWNMAEAIGNIAAELPSFAEYLRSYQVDWVLYNTAMDTPEKQAIVDGTTSQVRRYLHAIINHEITFFIDFEGEIDTDYIHRGLVEAFKVGKIEQGLLFEAYDKLYESKKSAKKFNAEVRNLSPDYFSREKLKKSNGKRYYEI